MEIQDNTTSASDQGITLEQTKFPMNGERSSQPIGRSLRLGAHQAGLDPFVERNEHDLIPRQYQSAYHARQSASFQTTSEVPVENNCCCYLR